MVSRIGRPEIGLEAGGVNLTDTWVLLNEPERWHKVRTKDELIDRIGEVCEREIPGTLFSFSQPIEFRFNELLSGVRAALGIGIFGDDLEMLQEKANAIAAVLRSTPGSTGVRAQMIGGLPFLRVEVDRDRIARYGINADDVLDAVAALGGKVVGQVVEGQRRFAIQVRFEARYRDDIETIRTLKITDPQGRMIPLEDLAEIRLEDDTYEIWPRTASGGSWCSRTCGAGTSRASSPTSSGGSPPKCCSLGAITWNGAGRSRICNRPRSA